MRSGIDHPVWYKHTIPLKLVGEQRVARHWKKSFVSRLMYRMGGDKLLVQQQDGSWLQHDQCLHQLHTRSTRIHFEELGNQHMELPREHRIVDVQRRRTILVAEHNNLPEVETTQSINEEAQIIKPRIHQYTFAAFESFISANTHLVVANTKMQHHAFQRILADFPPEREGFDLLIERLREGKDVNAATDGSHLDDGRASAGWLMWTMSNEINDEGQSTRRQMFLLGSTMCVDGRLDANTAFRVEALGCLIIPIIICLTNEFIHQNQRL